MGIFFKVFGFWFWVSGKYNSQTQKVNDKVDTEKTENVLRNGY